MLLPIEEETAISPNPFLATMTEVIKSGTDVPAARIVKPMTCKNRIGIEMFLLKISTQKIKLPKVYIIVLVLIVMVYVCR